MDTVDILTAILVGAVVFTLFVGVCIPVTERRGGSGVKRTARVCRGAFAVGSVCCLSLAIAIPVPLVALLSLAAVSAALMGFVPDPEVHPDQERLAKQQENRLRREIHL